MIFKKVSISIICVALLTLACKSAEKNKKETEKPKIKDGKGEITWDDGSIKGKGNFTNYQKEGEWMLFHKGTGEKLAQGNYTNDKQNGFWTYYFKNGKKNTEGEFIEDQKTGEWKGYYESGEEMWTAKYIIKNAESGKLGLLEGIKTTKYKSGKVKMVEEYKNGEKKGKYQEYNEDGSPKEISWFTNDNHNGQCNVYWENGNLKEQGMYKDNLRAGEWKMYHDNGQLYTTGKFIIGKMNLKGEEKVLSQPDGRWQFYSKEGLIQKEGDYEAGKEKGLWKFYTHAEGKNRSLAMELTLTGGMATGFGKINDKGISGEGELTGLVKGVYKKSVNNSAAGEENYMDVPPDKPKEKVSYKWTGTWNPPKKNGKWTEFYPGGKNKKFEAVYLMEKLNGIYKEYYNNGKIKAEGEYMNGKKNGTWKVYKENGSIDEENSGNWMLDKKLKM